MKLRSTLVFSLILFVAACGSGGMDTSDTTSPSAVASKVDFNDDDVMFSQMMIPHHEQAIEMSDIALDPTVGASDVVKGLATQIKGAQDPEISQMKAWLADWGKSLDMGSHDMSMMEGMLSADGLTNLGSLRNTEFDTAWIKGMIGHHEGAIKMATIVIEKGSNSQVRLLAEAVISGQQKEIDTMKALLG